MTAPAIRWRRAPGGGRMAFVRGVELWIGPSHDPRTDAPLPGRFDAELVDDNGGSTSSRALPTEAAAENWAADELRRRLDPAPAAAPFSLPLIPGGRI